MPLINTTPTVEQYADNILVRINSLHGMFTAGFLAIARDVWSDDGRFTYYTPEEKIAALGTQAKAVFEASAATIEYLYAITGVVHEIVPAGYTVTFDAEGRATVTFSPVDQPVAGESESSDQS